MNLEPSLARPQLPARRDVNPYDAPAKPDDAADKERDRIREEQAHPFIHYLGQMVPNLALAAEFESEDEAIAAEGELEAASRSSHQLIPIGLPRSRPEAEPRDLPSQPLPLPLGNAVLLPKQQEVQPGLPKAQPVYPVEIPSMVYAQVSRMVQGNVPAAQIKVTLAPVHLGTIELAFTYSQQKVSVNVMAATAQAKEHLEAQLGHIRSILHAHQLQTGELKVVLAKPGTQGGSMGRESGSQSTAPSFRRLRRRSGGSDLDLAAKV